MNKMKTKTNLIRRVCLAIALLLLIGVLGSCGGKKAVLEVGNIERIADPNSGKTTTLNAVVIDQLSAISKMLKASAEKGFNAKGYLEAANRGYSMADVDASVNMDTDKGFSLEYAKAVITAANAKVDEADKISFSYDHMNQHDVKSLIDSANADFAKVELIQITEEVKYLNALSKEELQDIADKLSKTYQSKNFDPRELLIAASRGYSMDDVKEPDEDTDYTVDKGPNLEYAVDVLDAANEELKKNEKITVDYEKMNEYDLLSLINAFRTEVDLNAKGGFFDPLLLAIGKGLDILIHYVCFDSYLLGICLFAIIIEIIMLPFAIKQQKHSIKQAQLRPKEMAIRNKYKGRNDQVTMQKMQQEIQEFYQRENFSPYSGCLPLLIQMPIILALYNIIIDPLHYVLGKASTLADALNAYYSASAAAGGYGGSVSGNGSIALLSKIRENTGVLDGVKDFAFFKNGEAVFDEVSSIAENLPKFNVGNINFGLTPSFSLENWVLLLVPVLTFATYFITSKLNRKLVSQPITNNGVEDRQVACSNSMMDITMPAMSTFFTFMVPALVGVYWMFRSVVSFGKQFIISRIMPLPKFTEEDYKAAAKEMAGKRVVKKSEKVGKVRSLHYIDDEDFDDTRERALARKEALEAQEQEKQKNAKTPFDSAPVKEKNPNNKNKEDKTADKE